MVESASGTISVAVLLILTSHCHLSMYPMVNGMLFKLNVLVSGRPCINESFVSGTGNHLEIHVAQHGLIAGGDVRFPSTMAPPLISHDFSNGMPS
jgi:hypothetical protein